MTLLDEPACMLGENHDWEAFGNFCVKCGLVSSTRKKKSSTARGGGPSKTHRQIGLCLARDGFWCYYCHAEFVNKGMFYETAEGVRATRDHVLPRSKNGHSRLENLVAACQTCNVKKANDSLEGRYGVWLKSGPIRVLNLRAAGGATHEYLKAYALQHATIVPLDYEP